MSRSLCRGFESRPFGERLAACEAMVECGYRERVRAAVAELVLPTPPIPFAPPGDVACLLLYGEGFDIAGRGPDWGSAYRDALERELCFLDAEPADLADCWEKHPPKDPGAYLRKYVAELAPVLVIGPRALTFAERVVT